MIDHATSIPPLLIAVECFWINEDREWPDWRQICLQDATVLQHHPWWARANIDGPAENPQGESSGGDLQTRAAGTMPAVGSDVVVKVEEVDDAWKIPTMSVGSQSRLTAAQWEIPFRRSEEHAQNRLNRVMERRKQAARPRKRIQAMTATRPPPRDMRSPSSEPDVAWAYDIPCGQCIQANNSCYRPERGLSCRACTTLKRRCDKSASPPSWSIARPPPPMSSAGAGPSHLADIPPAASHSKSPSPPLAIRRVRRQHRPTVPFEGWADKQALRTVKKGKKPIHICCVCLTAHPYPAVDLIKSRTGGTPAESSRQASPSPTADPLPTIQLLAELDELRLEGHRLMSRNQELLEITKQLTSASAGMRAELTQMGQERFSPQDQIGMIKAAHGEMEQAFDRSSHRVCDFQIHIEAQ